MTKLLGKNLARKSRVTGRGGLHGRTMNFFDAALRRLAWNDYDKVSVAMICRDARSTPYTFYRRFPNKRAFLYALVLVSFRSRTSAFNETMGKVDWKVRTPLEIIDRVVDEVVTGTMTVSGVGVTQLAVRLGMSKPRSAQPYFNYREAVTGRAVALLSPKIEGDALEQRIRSVVQLLFATATDEAWRHGIPFTTARKRELAKDYCQLVLRGLGLPAGGGDAGYGRLRSAVLPELPYPDDMQTIYPLSKRALRSYEKEIRASRKPDFVLNEPIEPLDALIEATRDEDRKSQKPFKKPRSRRKRRFRVV